MTAWTTDSDNSSGDNGNKFYLIDMNSCNIKPFNNRKDLEDYIANEYDEESTDDLYIYYGLERTIRVTSAGFKVQVY